MENQNEVAEFDWNAWYKMRKEELYKITSNDQDVHFQLSVDKFLIQMCLKTPLLYDILDYDGKNWKQFLHISDKNKEEKIKIT